MGTIIHGPYPTPESGEVDQLVCSSAQLSPSARRHRPSGLRALEEAITQQLLAHAAANSLSSGRSHRPAETVIGQQTLRGTPLPQQPQSLPPLNHVHASANQTLGPRLDSTVIGASSAPNKDSSSAQEGTRGRVAWAPVQEAFSPVPPDPQMPLGGIRGQQKRTGTAGSSSGQLPPIRSPSNLDNVRRHLDVQICNRPLQLSAVTEISEVPSIRARLLQTAVRGLVSVNEGALRAGGVFPWSSGWLSKAYQWAIVFVHVLIVSGLLVHWRLSFGQQGFPFLAGDLVLASGCVCGLLATHLPNRNFSLEKGLSQLEASNALALFTSRVDASIAVDTLATVVMWLAFLGDRLGSAAVLSGQGLTLPWAEALRHSAVILCSGQLAALVLLVLRLTRNHVQFGRRLLHEHRQGRRLRASRGDLERASGPTTDVLRDN